MWRHRYLTSILYGAVALQVIVSLWQGDWRLVGMGVGTALAMAGPFTLMRRRGVTVPRGLETLSMIFIFAWLFLGEMQDFFTRFGWWDLLMHVLAGSLLSIIGFLLAHSLNSLDRPCVHMKPIFVAVFAFSFAISIGVLWEVVEYGLDVLFDTKLQKPMLGDPSGLTDTMLDLVADAGGAGVVAIYGYYSLHTPDQRSLLERWIKVFIDRSDP